MVDCPKCGAFDQLSEDWDEEKKIYHYVCGVCGFWANSTDRLLEMWSRK